VIFFFLSIAHLQQKNLKTPAYEIVLKRKTIS